MHERFAMKVMKPCWQLPTRLYTWSLIALDKQRSVTLETKQSSEIGR